MFNWFTKKESKNGLPRKGNEEAVSDPAEAATQDDGTWNQAGSCGFTGTATGTCGFSVHSIAGGPGASATQPLTSTLLQQAQAQLLQSGLGYFSSFGQHPMTMPNAGISGGLGPFAQQPGGIIPLAGWHLLGQSQLLHKLDLKREVVAGEITAWRIWRVDTNRYSSNRYGDRPLNPKNAILVSAVTDCPWHCGDMESAIDDHSQGFHCWKTLESAREYLTDFMGYITPMAIGSIEIWGDIIEHDDGYRAQFASVKSIDEIVLLGVNGFSDQELLPDYLEALRGKYCHE